MNNEIEGLVKVAKAALQYIDAIPQEVADAFHTMPGFDRDWAEEVISSAPKAYQQLAAENVALKASIPPMKMINDVTDSWDDVSLAEEVGFNRAISAIMKNIPETPATDRIVAGIKADAIDEAAVELDRVDTVASTRVIGFKLREFSQQLREGAGK
ncbi:hypothetical protein ACVSSC_21330 [Klebsiella pneumoniae]|uniref:hypothetical protein n=1 Tax=Klebsiella pneumoniae TaxID=573 RepID=UPI0032F20B4D|nr:hypothetical protein [Klebsiella pneumoniae]HBW8242586.1 hypothetical protein [Klebsiella pneumoniae]